MSQNLYTPASSSPSFPSRVKCSLIRLVGAAGQGQMTRKWEKIGRGQDRSGHGRGKARKSQAREAASYSPKRDKAQVQAPEEERGRQKDALMPGSDVEGETTRGWRMKNGGEDRAGPHG